MNQEQEFLVQAALGMLKNMTKKKAQGMLAFVAARLCDEMGIDRNAFCTMVLEKPNKSQDKGK